MGKYPRDEIEKAFEHYREVVIATNPKGSDKRPWANLFTEDCVYFEHARGTFHGSEAIFNWISNAMRKPIAEEFVEFPVEWYVIDEENDRVIAYLQNRMSDPGDGEIYQEPNVSILHYAGNNKWDRQEDIYNPLRMKVLCNRWIDARSKVTGEAIPAYNG